MIYKSFSLIQSKIECGGLCMANSPVCKAFVYDLNSYSCSLLDFDQTYQGSAQTFLNGPGYVSLGKKKVFLYTFTEVTFQQNSELQIPKTSQILPHTLDKLYFKYFTMSPAFFCPQIARLRITRAACVF